MYIEPVLRRWRRRVDGWERVFGWGRIFCWERHGRWQYGGLGNAGL